MKVFCALITTMGNCGRASFIRQKLEDVLVGHHDIGDDEIAIAASTQRERMCALPVARTSYPARESAWLTTVRIARSSSATWIVRAIAFWPSLLVTVPDTAFCLPHRRVDSATGGEILVPLLADGEHAEQGLAPQALALDHATMVTDYLRHQSKTEASSGRLAGHERLEEMRHQVFGNARPVIDHADLEGQRDPSAARRHLHGNAGRNAVVSRIRPSG